MTARSTTALAIAVFGSTLVAQTAVPRLPPPPATPVAPSLQTAADPGYADLIATCKTPPPARGGRPGGPARGGGAGGRGPAPAAGVREYTVTEIPGVIAAGQRWSFVWQEVGNNGDGIIGTDDGGLLLAQNDNSRVVRLDRDGRPTVVHSDTRTGGALSINKKGELFLNQRALRTAVVQLAPSRRVLADRYQGDPLDCIGGVLNDLAADSKGGVYFTMGGVFHADPAGNVTRYGDGLATNGIVLSADERVLYVTNGATLVAFDVQQDGSLTNQREFAKLEGGGGGDGLAIDAEGRVYVTSQPGVQVVGRDGRYLGLIPTPRGVISGAFGGADKKTFYILARGAQAADGSEVANAAQVWTIPMLAAGYKGRPK